jgi:pilus assembly protein CpaB
MAKNYISTYQNQLARANAASQQAIKTVDVLITERALKYGEAVQLADVKLVKFPKDSLPEGTFATIEEMFSKGESTPRVVLRAMEKAEVIMAVKVTEPGEDAGITSRLERGQRAFAIRVDVSSGVSGFLRPGDRVDVYWTGEVGARSNTGHSEVTKLIEAGIRLIAVDQTASGDAAEATIARTVTVSASPQQVAALAQAQTTGNLSLSLVGAEDDTIAQAIEVDQRSLLGLASAPIAQAAIEEKVCTIRTRRGAEVAVLEIPCTN